jgi:hypothetical protein
VFGWWNIRYPLFIFEQAPYSVPAMAHGRFRQAPVFRFEQQIYKGIYESELLRIIYEWRAFLAFLLFLLFFSKTTPGPRHQWNMPGFG